MKKDFRCPICEEGNLSERVGKNRVDYKGKTTELDSHFSVCDFCGSEQANAQQVRMNKRYMVAFKKQVDGLLTGSEVRSVRERLGLTQAGAAKIFGGGPVAFSKYESDDVTQSEAMDKLLCVAVEVPEAFVYLAERAKVNVIVDDVDLKASYYRQSIDGRSYVYDVRLPEGRAVVEIHGLVIQEYRQPQIEVVGLPEKYDRKLSSWGYDA